MPWVIICAIIGGTINVIGHWDVIKEKGFGTGVLYFVAGAAAGTAASLTGGLVGASLTPLGIGMAGTGVLGGAIIGGAAGLANGLVLGTSNSLISGNSITEALKDGLIEMGKDGLAGAITGGICGGIKASIEGRNIWSGKYSTETLLEKTGYKANAAIDGEGHTSGTNKHTYAKNLIEKRQGVYKANKELVCEKTVTRNGQIFRFDVRNTLTNEVWDYKFGYLGKTLEYFYKSAQFRRYRRNFPEYTFKPLHIK